MGKVLIVALLAIAAGYIYRADIARGINDFWFEGSVASSGSSLIATTKGVGGSLTSKW